MKSWPLVVVVAVARTTSACHHILILTPYFWLLASSLYTVSRLRLHRLRVICILLACFLGSGCKDSDSQGRQDAGRDAGAIGPWGGEVDLLKFAVWSDVQPPDMNQTAQYPVAIFKSVCQGIAKQRVQFVIAGGDYMFANNDVDVKNQLDILLHTEAEYGVFTFHAMGNHECRTATSSNCPLGDETPNAQGFMSRLIPFSQTPYLLFSIQTSLGEAKFIVIAANAWSIQHMAWLQNVVARKTPYTFIVRHTPPDDERAPGTEPSEQLLDGVQYTLGIFAHSHRYRRIYPNGVIGSTAGAPISGEGNFHGYLIVEQQRDGNIKATEHRAGSDTVADTWSVTPEGEPVE